RPRRSRSGPALARPDPGEPEHGHRDLQRGVGHRRRPHDLPAGIDHGSRAMSPRRMLQIAGTAELVTLILMLANMLTVHAPAFSQILEPLHGLAYMATVLPALPARRHRPTA